MELNIYLLYLLKGVNSFNMLSFIKKHFITCLLIGLLLSGLSLLLYPTFSNIWNELKDIMTRRLGLEFVNIVENERGTTFHTNHINDTNPVSAFITYRKPRNGEKTEQQVKKGNIFEGLPESYWNKERSFREVQSEIIVIANELNYEIPSEKEILNWLKCNCETDGDRFNKR